MKIIALLFESMIRRGFFFDHSTSNANNNNPADPSMLLLQSLQCPSDQALANATRSIPIHLRPFLSINNPNEIAHTVDALNTRLDAINSRRIQRMQHKNNIIARNENNTITPSSLSALNTTDDGININSKNVINDNRSSVSIGNLTSLSNFNNSYSTSETNTNTNTNNSNNNNNVVYVNVENSIVSDNDNDNNNNNNTISSIPPPLTLFQKESVEEITNLSSPSPVESFRKLELSSINDPIADIAKYGLVRRTVTANQKGPLDIVNRPCEADDCAGAGETTSDDDDYVNAFVSRVRAGDLQDEAGPGDRFTADAIVQSLPRSQLSFYARHPPPISLGDYITHILTCVPGAADLLVIALVYLVRLGQAVPVCSRSIHRMLLTALVVAEKMCRDHCPRLSFYAKVGGVGVHDLTNMEIAFLQSIGFNTLVRTGEYVDMIYSLRQHCATLVHALHEPWVAEAWAALIAAVKIPSRAILAREIAAFQEEEKQNKTKQKQQQQSEQSRKKIMKCGNI